VVDFFFSVCSVGFASVGSSEENYAKNFAIQSVKLGFRYVLLIVVYTQEVVNAVSN